MDFEFGPLGVRTVFGAGKAESLPAEVRRLGASRVLVCGSTGARARAAPLIDALGDLCAGVFDGARPHCPEPTVDAALAMFGAVDADGVVAVGGGSTIGLGKYIRVRTGRPLVVVPTTYSGSEQTSIYGIKIGDQKRTWNDPGCMASTVLYDSLLTLSLSPHHTATSGMNGLAHCVEALYPARPNPVAATLAEAAIGAFATGLPASVARPDDIAARTLALYGGFLGGLLVGLAGIAIHHRICHVLGGLYDIPHGESNAVILPHAAAFNALAAPDAMAAIRRAMAAADAPAALYDLARRMGAPTDLKSLGMPADGLVRCAEDTVRTLKYNPRPADRDGVLALLRDAYEGRRPGER